MGKRGRRAGRPEAPSGGSDRTQAPVGTAARGDLRPGGSDAGEGGSWVRGTGQPAACSGPICLLGHPGWRGSAGRNCSEGLCTSVSLPGNRTGPPWKCLSAFMFPAFKHRTRHASEMIRVMMGVTEG